MKTFGLKIGSEIHEIPDPTGHKRRIVYVLDHDYEKFFPVEPGDVVVDCGATVGAFICKVGAKAGKIVAVEPDLRNVKKLLSALEQFKLRSKATVVGCALWNETGERILQTEESGVGNTLVHGLEKANPPKTVKVPVDTLDNVMRSLGVSKVGFLKMDIEGAELEALEGAKETLAKTRKVAVASYHVRNNKPTSGRVAAILKAAGFAVSASAGLVYGRKPGVEP